MIKRYLAIFVSGVFLGGVCLSMTPGYNDNSSSPRYPRNVRPGVSDNSSDSQQSQQQSQRQASGREKLAYMDDRDEDIHHRANRQGDWDFKSNWRYDRKAFYKGETQGEAYEQEHNPYKGGIGMDPDPEILQMHKYYEEDARRNQQNVNSNQRNPNQRPNGYNQYNGNQRSYNNSYGRGYDNNPSPANQRNNNNPYYRGEENSSNNNYYYYQENPRTNGY